MRKVFIKTLQICIILSLFPASGLPAESGWNEAGVRIGIQASPRRIYFRQYDVFTEYGLPWEWRGSSSWGLTQHVTASLGVLNHGKDSGFIGSVGTEIILDKHGPGFSADLGINTNLLNKRHIGIMDFGSILQFGAYLGINYRFANNLKIGYRLQHISNGHIFYPEDNPNPGIDMHMIGLSTVF